MFTIAKQKSILLICGTAETSDLTTIISNSGFNCVLSTATDAYLETDNNSQINVLRRCGRLNYDGFLQLINENKICAIVNACHPYAAELRNTIYQVVEKTKLPCFNYIRPEFKTINYSNVLFAESHEKAAELAFSFNKPVFLTIGSNNLHYYTTTAREMNISLIARVLPRIDSLTACTNAGLLDHEIIAARGPFTVDENLLIIRKHAIGVLVTKNSGKGSGFEEKIEAAKICGCIVIIVERPKLTQLECSVNTSDLYTFLETLTSVDQSFDTSKDASYNDAMKDITNKHGGNLREISVLSGIPQKRILDFSANINPIGPIPKLKSIFQNSFDQIVHYPDPDCVDLKKEISRFGNWPSEMLITANGASELLYASVSACQKLRAIIPIPSYSDYTTAANRIGIEVRHILMSDRNQFALDLQLISDIITDNDVVIIGRPNNPTGNCISSEMLSEFIKSYSNTFFIIDESFIEFSTQKSIAEALPENCVMIRSMTKFYAIPGLRLGYAVAHPSAAQSINDKLTPWSVNYFAQIAGIHSLQNSYYQNESRKALKEYKDSFLSKLEKIPFFSVFPSESNFILIKLKHHLSGSVLYSKLLTYGIAIRKCSNFHGLNDNYIRIAIRNEQDNNFFIEVMEKLQDEFL